MKKIYFLFLIAFFVNSLFAQHTWDGSESNDWQTAANWDQNSIPNSSDNVVITTTGTAPVIDDGTTVAQCNNMTINSGAVLTIETNGRLTISGSVTNNAGASGFVIKSDQNGDGSVIVNNAFAATVQRFMQAGVNQYFTPTVSGLSASDFSEGFLYYYDESASDYWIGTDNYTEDTDGWQQMTGSLNQDDAYAYSHSTNITKSLTGTLLFENSPSNINLSYTTHSGNTPDPPDDPYTNFDGWNLIGNKYTCVLDWDNSNNTKNYVDNIVYYYDGTNSRYAYYNGNTGLGSNGGTQYIPAQQGFFVKAQSGGTSNINFDKSARMHYNQDFWKNNNNYKKDIDNLIRIEADANNNTEEAIVGFLPDALPGEDDYDTYRVPGTNPDNPEIYSVIENITNGFVHNFLPIPDSLIAVPLGICVSEGSQVTFTFTQVDLPLADYAYLEDTYSKNYIELNQAGTYQFTQTNEGSVEDRFILQIGVNSPPTIISTIDNQSVEADSYFNLDVSGTFEDYDILDQITYTSTLSDGNILPEWLYFDPQNLTYSGTPTANDTGTVSIDLIAFDSYGDSASTNFNLTVTNQTNTKELNSILEIYPNPVKNNLIIKNCKKLKTVTITDLTGKIILRKNNFESKNNINNINFSQINSGIYIIEFKFKNEKSVFKKIIKK